MREIFIGCLFGLILSSCSPEAQVATSNNKCVTELFASYNPKVLRQCVEACIKCDHGTPTTCTTSCTLKGAN